MFLTFKRKFSLTLKFHGTLFVAERENGAVTNKIWRAFGTQQSTKILGITKEKKHLTI